MCTLWHSKHSYVTNVRLACKVCEQELLCFLYESSSNTPAHVSDNKSPNLTGKRRCLHSKGPRVSSLLSIERFSEWRCAMKTSSNPRPLTDTPEEPASTTGVPHFQHQSQIRDVLHSSSFGCDRQRWVCSGDFVDAYWGPHTWEMASSHHDWRWRQMWSTFLRLP